MLSHNSFFKLHKNVFSKLFFIYFFLSFSMRHYNVNLYLKDLVHQNGSKINFFKGDTLQNILHKK